MTSRTYKNEPATRAAVLRRRADFFRGLGWPLCAAWSRLGRTAAGGAMLFCHVTHSFGFQTGNQFSGPHIV